MSPQENVLVLVEGFLDGEEDTVDEWEESDDGG